MGKSYETIILIDNEKKDKIKETIDKVVKIISNFKGEITKKDDIGNKKLAYPIKNKKEAYYYLLEYKLKQNESIETLDKIESEFKTIENIMKFLSIRIDE